MLDAISWYIAIQSLGIIAFPAAFVLFSRLPERGFTLAKPAGMVFFAYLLWVLGLTHIAPNTQLTIVVVLSVDGDKGRRCSQVETQDADIQTKTHRQEAYRQGRGRGT